MARFFGSVKGSRGEATRLGGMASGMTVVAASWSGGVRTTLFDRDGEDWCRIELCTWESAGTNEVLYIGPVCSVRRVGLTETGKVAKHLADNRKLGT